MKRLVDDGISARVQSLLRFRWFLLVGPQCTYCRTVGETLTHCSAGKWYCSALFLHVCLPRAVACTARGRVAHLRTDRNSRGKRRWPLRYVNIDGTSSANNHRSFLYIAARGICLVLPVDIVYYRLFCLPSSTMCMQHELQRWSRINIASWKKKHQGATIHLLVARNKSISLVPQAELSLYMSPDSIVPNKRFSFLKVPLLGEDAADLQRARSSRNSRKTIGETSASE